MFKPTHRTHVMGNKTQMIKTLLFATNSEHPDQADQHVAKANQHNHWHHDDTPKIRSLFDDIFSRGSPCSLKPVSVQDVLEILEFDSLSRNIYGVNTGTKSGFK